MDGDGLKVIPLIVKAVNSQEVKVNLDPSADYKIKKTFKHLITQYEDHAIDRTFIDDYVNNIIVGRYKRQELRLRLVLSFMGADVEKLQMPPVHHMCKSTIVVKGLKRIGAIFRRNPFKTTNIFY